MMLMKHLLIKITLTPKPHLIMKSDSTKPIISILYKFDKIIKSHNIHIKTKTIK